MNIAYYLSGHGFGHISRSSQVVFKLLEDADVKNVYLMTTRGSFLKSIPSKLTIRNVQTDPGIVQHDSISLDVMGTLKEIEKIESQKTELLQQELKFVQEKKIDRIVSDSSSFPFVIGKKSNIPSIFVGNFTWDFIYANYQKVDPYFKDYTEKLKEEYSYCDLGLILPFHCPVTSIPKIYKTGLLGRKPTRNRDELRVELNFRDEYKYLLFSFGAYGILDSKFNIQKLNPNYKIVVSGYDGLWFSEVLRMDSVYYPDLLCACDAVITKPGYGILSEAYFAQTPILYTDRGDFAEYPYLKEALDTYFYSCFVKNDQVYELDFDEAVQSIQERGVKERIEDGLETLVSKIKKAAPPAGLEPATQ